MHASKHKINSEHASLSIRVRFTRKIFIDRIVLILFTFYTRYKFYLAYLSSKAESDFCFEGERRMVKSNCDNDCRCIWWQSNYPKGRKKLASKKKGHRIIFVTRWEWYLHLYHNENHSFHTIFALSSFTDEIFFAFRRFIRFFCYCFTCFWKCQKKRIRHS